MTQDALHQPTGRFQRVGDMPDGAYFVPAPFGLREPVGFCERVGQDGFKVTCLYRRDWHARPARFTLFAHVEREVLIVNRLRRAA